MHKGFREQFGVGQCALPSCGKRFTKLAPTQRYCSVSHQRQNLRRSSASGKRVQKTRPNGVPPNIDVFQGPHAFLSNFYPASVVMHGRCYRTAEHAFQAHKSIFVADREAIAACKTPAQAKAVGRSVRLRGNWEAGKYQVMQRVVSEKFAQHPELAKQLVATGNALLVEGNTWGDTTWGVCADQGQNWLGKILMQVREEIKARGSSKL